MPIYAQYTFFGCSDALICSVTYLLMSHIYLKVSLHWPEANVKTRFKTRMHSSTFHFSARLGGGCLPGWCLSGGGCTPPVNRMTDRCRIITFPQLRLRAVTRRSFSRRPTAHFPTGPESRGTCMMRLKLNMLECVWRWLNGEISIWVDGGGVAGAPGGPHVICDWPMASQTEVTWGSPLWTDRHDC